MKTIIIDNEPNIICGLSQLLQLYAPEIELIGTAGNLEDGLALLKTQQPDLLFLDVELDDGTGMDLLSRLPAEPTFELIFITAYEKYALDAFKFSAIEFLLKPIDPDDLIQSMEKVRQRRKDQSWKLRFSVLSENIEILKSQNRKIVLKGKEQVYVVKLADILYCEASSSYTFFHLSGDKILMSKSLKYYEELLKPYGFIRVHHSFLINQQKIAKYDRLDCTLVLDGGQQVPVSHRKKEVLSSFLEEGLFL